MATFFWGIYSILLFYSGLRAHTHVSSEQADAVRYVAWQLPKSEAETLHPAGY